MKKKNMLFTSAGDNTNFDELYISENMNYDVYVIYYGNNEEKFKNYKSKVKFIEKRKGSKFQNFKYFYEKYFYIYDKYEYFFIIDDDILIDSYKINELFSIAKKYDLYICGPSFSNGSKISHNITKYKKNIVLTYTNFIEVNVPLFNKKALNNLMKYLDYSLIGWGIDYLYMWANISENHYNKFAIIHKINCINPKDKDKKEKARELNKIKNCSKKKKTMEPICKKNRLQFF